MSDRRFAAIVSIDTVDYSRLMQEDAKGLVAALNAIVRKLAQPMIAEQGGRLVKLVGDAALVEFPSATGALTFAVGLQRAMAGDVPYTYHERIRARIGVHAGDVLVSEDDLFGEAVNVAARLQAAAPPDGIFLSRLVADLAGSDLRLPLNTEGTHRYKNIARPIETLSVDLAGNDATQTPQRMAETQEVRFCRGRDGAMLAWTENGEGPPVVKAPNWIGHLEHDWQNPGIAPVIAAIGEQYRLVRFDARGNGLSDWNLAEMSFESLVDDLEAIFDASGIDRAPILAISQGSAIAAAFAARAPERVSGIVMMGSFPLGRAVRPSEKDRARAEAMRAMMQAGWDDDYPSLRDLIAETIVPSASIEDRRTYAELMRDTISPGNLARYREVIDHMDVTALLPRIEAPCLVMHARGDRMQPIEQGRLMASGLSNARFQAYDSPNHVFTANDPVWPIARRDLLAFLAEVA